MIKKYLLAFLMLAMPGIALSDVPSSPMAQIDLLSNQCVKDLGSTDEEKKQSARDLIGYLKVSEYCRQNFDEEVCGGWYRSALGVGTLFVAGNVRSRLKQNYRVFFQAVAKQAAFMGHEDYRKQYKEGKDGSGHATKDKVHGTRNLAELSKTKAANAEILEIPKEAKAADAKKMIAAELDRLAGTEKRLFVVREGSRFYNFKEQKTMAKGGIAVEVNIVDFNNNQLKSIGADRSYGDNIKPYARMVDFLVKNPNATPEQLYHEWHKIYKELNLAWLAEDVKNTKNKRLILKYRSSILSGNIHNIQENKPADFKKIEGLLFQKDGQGRIIEKDGKPVIREDVLKMARYGPDYKNLDAPQQAETRATMDRFIELRDAKLTKVFGLRTSILLSSFISEDPALRKLARGTVARASGAFAVALGLVFEKQITGAVKSAICSSGTSDRDQEFEGFIDYKACSSEMSTVPGVHLVRFLSQPQEFQVKALTESEDLCRYIRGLTGFGLARDLRGLKSALGFETAELSEQEIENNGKLVELVRNNKAVSSDGKERLTIVRDELMKIEKVVIEYSIPDMPKFVFTKKSLIGMAKETVENIVAKAKGRKNGISSDQAFVLSYQNGGVTRTYSWDEIWQIHNRSYNIEGCGLIRGASRAVTKPVGLDGIAGLALDNVLSCSGEAKSKTNNYVETAIDLFMAINKIESQVRLAGDAAAKN